MASGKPLDPLSLQRLPSRQAQVLAVAHLAGLSQPDGWFMPAQVKSLFERLRVPAPGNVNQELARLKEAGQLLRRARTPGWALTPEGRQTLVAVMGELPGPAVTAGSGTELDGERHQLIPPMLAPHAWQPALVRLNEKLPFERNVFLMTRFPTRADDPLAAVVDLAASVCEQHGLALLRADAVHADPLLTNNVFAHMWACQYGLALLEAFGDPPRKPAALNENLILEVGGMLMTGRRCAIIKDESVKQIPTDLVAHIYHPARFVDLETVERALHAALVKDFGTSPCAGCD